MYFPFVSIDFRPTKDRIWRYFRLSSRRSDSDNKLETQRSTENSITQENTTETMDIEAKQSISQKSIHAAKPMSKLSTQSTANALKIKKTTNRANPNRTNRSRIVHKDSIRPMRVRSSDDMNNSCSNITASTYINGNEMSASSGIGLDLESGIPTDLKSNYDRDSVYSSDRFSHRSQDRLSESGHLLLRRESSSTYERDMDIIDLLERERSMDLQEIVDRERHSGDRHRKKVPTVRSNSGVERRKLPDIAKITAAAPVSPKRFTTAEPNNFPNFVFTHQFNEFAEARSNRNRDSNNASTSAMSKSRNNSQTSFGKRNSDAHQWDDENALGNLNRVTRARSIDSRKSSTKSIHDNRLLGNTTNTSGTYANNL